MIGGVAPVSGGTAPSILQVKLNRRLRTGDVIHGGTMTFFSADAAGEVVAVRSGCYGSGGDLIMEW